MKIPRWFNQNRILGYLRTATVVTLISGAAAFAFVAVKPSSPLQSSSKPLFNKFGQDPDAFGNKVAAPGPGQDRGPLAAALEDFAHRAYPLDDIPTEASLDAI